jgi:hypothetical protein
VIVPQILCYFLIVDQKLKKRVVLGESLEIVISHVFKRRIETVFLQFEQPDEWVLD